MTTFDPAHPGELIRETIKGLREETGKSLTIEEAVQRPRSPDRSFFLYSIRK